MQIIPSGKRLVFASRPPKKRLKDRSPPPPSFHNGFSARRKLLQFINWCFTICYTREHADKLGLSTPEEGPAYCISGTTYILCLYATCFYLYLLSFPILELQ